MMTKAAEKALSYSLKLITRKENGKHETFLNQKTNDYTYYSDGHALALVPNSQAVIYSDKYISTGIASCYQERFLHLNSIPDTTQQWKGESRVIPFGGNKSGTIIILYHNDSEVWIDEKLLKNWFGDPKYLQFITTGEKSPIYIYEMIIPVGLILPINKQSI